MSKLLPCPISLMCVKTKMCVVQRAYRRRSYLLPTSSTVDSFYGGVKRIYHEVHCAGVQNQCLSQMVTHVTAIERINRVGTWDLKQASPTHICQSPHSWHSTHIMHWEHLMYMHITMDNAWWHLCQINYPITKCPHEPMALCSP